MKINPREDLEDMFRRLMNHNSQKLEEVLPDRWDDQRKKAVSLAAAIPVR